MYAIGTAPFNRVKRTGIENATPSQAAAMAQRGTTSFRILGKGTTIVAMSDSIRYHPNFNRV